MLPLNPLIRFWEHLWSRDLSRSRYHSQNDRISLLNQVCLALSVTSITY